MIACPHARAYGGWQALVVLKQRPPELSTAAFIRALSGKQQREHRVLSNSVQQPQTGDPSHVDDLDAALVLYRNDTTTHTSGTARLATAALRWRQRAIDAEHV